MSDGPVAFLLGYGLGVVAHEFGHWSAATLVGLHPRRVRIGSGPVWLRLPLGRAWLEVRGLPTTGHVEVLMEPGRRLAYAAFFVGGAAANLALVALAALASAADPAAGKVCKAVAASQLLIMAATLIPYKRARAVNAPRGSDGWQLLALTRDRIGERAKARLATLLQGMSPAGAAPAPFTAVSSEIVYQSFRPDRRTEGWARAEASAVMAGLLPNPELSQPERVYILDFMVGNELLQGDTGAADAMLDAWSIEAAALRPNSSMRVTRASVLGVLGRWDEAELTLPPPDAEMHALDRVVAAKLRSHICEARRDLAGAAAWRQDAVASCASDPSGHLSSCAARLDELIGRRTRSNLGAADEHGSLGSGAPDAA